MSKTPRTDAATIIVEETYSFYDAKLTKKKAVVAQRFARELETELAEALGEIKGLRQLVNDCHIIAGQLETERNEARVEIERKDKLIEQMYEAIKFSLIADEVRQTRNVCASDINDACETSRIKRIAALSAAERGE